MYKKGKDLKIKGIENLEGLPDYIVYKTDKPETITWLDGMLWRKPSNKPPEGFQGW